MLFVPYGADFGDLDVYGPVITRLLVHSEMSASSECDFGTFSRPRGHMHQTYRELQDRVIEHRRQQAAHAADGGGASQLVETSEDLARMLREFASDGIVVRVLVDFALPPHKRARAASAVPQEPHAQTAGAATEPAASRKRTLKPDDDSHLAKSCVVGLTEHAAQAMARPW